MTPREPRPVRRVQVRGRSGVADLTVAADVPVRDLLPHLATALHDTSRAEWSLWLAESQPSSGAPRRLIADNESLAVAGVVHGDGLELVPLDDVTSATTRNAR